MVWYVKYLYPSEFLPEGYAMCQVTQLYFIPLIEQRAE